MLEAIFTLVLLAIDVFLALVAVMILMKAGVIIAIAATILWIVGVKSAGWVAIIATLFTIGKWIWVHVSTNRKK